jgi:hypothetical protein
LNLSENSGQVDEDLKSKVRNIFENIFNKYCIERKDCDGFPIGSICTNDVAFYDMEQELCNKIAALIASSRSQDNGAELLEALEETDKDLCVLESTMLQIEQRDHLAEGMTELVKKWRARNKQAISNYEKQSK